MPCENIKGSKPQGMWGTNKNKLVTWFMEDTKVPVVLITSKKLVGNEIGIVCLPERSPQILEHVKLSTGWA